MFVLIYEYLWLQNNVQKKERSIHVTGWATRTAQKSQGQEPLHKSLENNNNNKNTSCQIQWTVIKTALT